MCNYCAKQIPPSALSPPIRSESEKNRLKPQKSNRRPKKQRQVSKHPLWFLDTPEKPEISSPLPELFSI